MAHESGEKPVIGHPTPGPWHHDGMGHIVAGGHTIIAAISPMSVGADQASYNTLLIAASLELLEAAQLLEAAEESRQDCDECEDVGEPEACPKCFPKFDDARVKRRLAIAKATGEPSPQQESSVTAQSEETPAPPS